MALLSPTLGQRKLINKANNGIDKAEVVWADEANLVTLPTTSIYRDGNGNAFVKFEVKKEDIKSGNAVLAVKKGQYHTLVMAFVVCS